MGANRRNHIGTQSRRFSLCNRLLSDDTYVYLVNKYLDSKSSCQLNKHFHLIHEYNILKLTEYLNVVQKDFKHR